MAKPGSASARAIARGHGRSGLKPDTSGLEAFLERVNFAIAQDCQGDVMRMMAYAYPEELRKFREKNWRLLQTLGMEPAPAAGSGVREALTEGWFKMRLRDGTDGFFMRRTDDCSTATVATLVGCHPSLVPDPLEMQRILSGTDPEQVLSGVDDSYAWFASETGVRLRRTTSPPFWSKRWIGVVERDPYNPLANHLMVMSERELLFDAAHTYPHPDNQHTMLDGYGVDDISFGYVLED